MTTKQIDNLPLETMDLNQLLVIIALAGVDIALKALVENDQFKKGVAEGMVKTIELISAWQKKHPELVVRQEVGEEKMFKE